MYIILSLFLIITLFNMVLFDIEYKKMIQISGQKTENACEESLEKHCESLMFLCVNSKKEAKLREFPLIYRINRKIPFNRNIQNIFNKIYFDFISKLDSNEKLFKVCGIKSYIGKMEK